MLQSISYNDLMRSFHERLQICDNVLLSWGKLINMRWKQEESLTGCIETVKGQYISDN